MIDLRTAREQAGLTREQLAVKAGVTLSTIYRIETGKSGGSPLVRDVLAQAIGLAVNDIAWTKGQPEQASR